MDAGARFWRFVDRRGPDECWLWTGAHHEMGYGRFRLDGRTRPAHELALTFATGVKREPGQMTCHSCDNPPCCNPGHLRFDTPGSNVLDAYRRGRRLAVQKVTDAEVREMRAVAASGGVTDEDLARRYGVARSLVSQILAGNARAAAGGPMRAEHGSRKISDAEVILIRDRAAQTGVSGAELAREYNVTRALINGLLRGDLRPDVGGPLRPKRSNLKERQ